MTDPLKSLSFHEKLQLALSGDVSPFAFVSFETIEKLAGDVPPLKTQQHAINKIIKRQNLWAGRSIYDK